MRHLSYEKKSPITLKFAKFDFPVKSLQLKTDTKEKSQIRALHCILVFRLFPVINLWEFAYILVT